MTRPAKSEAAMKNWKAVKTDKKMVLGRYIVADPKVCGGRLTFRGTRVYVADVLQQAATGIDWEFIREALGKEVRGEGVIGLTRAFFYAGARSVMASLWMVGDQSTAILMRDFYSDYVKGEGPARSLRQAKLKLLKGDDLIYRHPFFWAPFILAGEY